MPATKIRLHHPTGRPTVETIKHFARENGTDVKGALALIAEWERTGVIKRRKDGGYDVLKFVPRQALVKRKEA